MNPKLTVENLSKFFGELRALEDVSLSLEAGQGLAIIGANGAGKSTLLNCVAGICEYEKGRIEIYGDTGADPHGQQVAPPTVNAGYLAHKSFLYDEMTVEANLHFWGRLAGEENYRARAAELIEDALLANRAGDKVRTLSAGMQKRAALCRAIMNRPDILLLDEPYSAFDQSGTVFLKKVIADIRRSKGIVIMATHYLEQAVTDCTHVALLQRGRVEMVETVGRIDVKALRERLSPIGDRV
jgi:heme exporter protein A